MEYFIFGSVSIIILLLLVQYFSKGRLKTDIEKIRMDWGKPKSKSHFNFIGIEKYADTVKETFHRLTAQTIDDIDFHKLFKFIDRTTSKVGQQFLYKKGIEPSNQKEHPLEESIKLFSENTALREKIQLELSKLNNDDAYTIVSLLHDASIEKPKWFKLLTLDIILVAGLLILSFKYPILLIILLLPITINSFLHLWNKSNTFYFVRSIPQLNILINVSKELLKKDAKLYNRSVEESIINLKSFQKKAQLIRFEDGGILSDFDIFQYAFDLIKAVFLIEVFMVFKIVKELKDKRSSIITLFNYVGSIDASISIASLRAGELKTCQPVFREAKKEVIVKNIYHPLIKNCVENSLAINNKSILITGSNMSGKSTFLRTLMINSILAQTIYTCFAAEYSSPVLKQFSSIRIDDNLFEGKSYYFQEVSTIASFIEEAKLPHQNVFFLDEVFKGTNTVERIAAAKGILSYLNRKNNIVVVSTHDIELATMLEKEYDLYHFTETIESDELHFDHSIKSGQLRTTNAIKILEISGYPPEILNEARQISKTLRTDK